MLPKRGWRWIKIKGGVGVWLARSSDGLWSCGGEPLPRLVMGHERLASGRHVFRIVCGEFAGAVIFDHGRFKSGGERDQPAT